MVDVFKIKQGDTIKFRNGQVHTVKEVTPHADRPAITIWIERHLEPDDCFTYGDSSGLYHSGYSDELSDWDIVEHIPSSAAVEPTQDETAIRDKFASDYIQQLNVWPEGYAMGHHAKRAYEYADAMMKARKENG